MADANLTARASREVPIVFDSLEPVRRELTAERLRRLMTYDPDTGELRWLVVKNNAKPGGRVGHPDRQGYIRCKVDGALHLGHRLAWLHVHGVWPSGVIDHINGNPSDNRLCNLRNVTQRVNMQNKRKAFKTASGMLGVHASKDAWVARIGHEGRQTHLGRFKTREEAHEAYLVAKRRLHEGCTI